MNKMLKFTISVTVDTDKVGERTPEEMADEIHARWSNLDDEHYPDWLFSFDSMDPARS